ncbi:hypothetical protein D3C73_1591130 [compost metagenome]
MSRYLIVLGPCAAGLADGLADTVAAGLAAALADGLADGSAALSSFPQAAKTKLTDKTRLAIKPNFLI